MNAKAIALVLAIAITSGCSQAPTPARHTVSDYRADKSLRREQVRQCVNDPGTLGKTPDCVNALEAERLASHGSLRNSGPIGLDPAKRH